MSHAEETGVSDADRGNGDMTKSTRAEGERSLARRRTAILSAGEETLRPEEPNTEKANNVTAVRVRPGNAESMVSRPDIVNSTVHGRLTLLDNKLLAIEERIALGRRRLALLAENAAPAARNTNDRKVKFSENLVTSMDSTALPREHDHPRWAKDPKWIVCKICSNWRKIVPSKKMKKEKVSKTRCSCSKGVLNAKGADEGYRIGNERSVKKRVRDKRGEGDQTPEERNRQPVSKKPRKLR